MTLSYMEKTVFLILCGLIVGVSKGDPVEHHKEVSIKHSVAPVASCDTFRPVNVQNRVEDCIHQCSLEPNYAGRMQITLMKDVTEGRGPEIISCSKVKLTQTFTETWTFTRIESELKSEKLQVSLTECQEAIKRNCTGQSCNYLEPRFIEPSYAYASDFTKTMTSLSLSSHTASVLEVEKKMMIIPPFSGHRFPIEDGHAEVEGRYLIWDPNYQQKECPYTEGLQMGCDIISYDGVKRAVCGGGKFAFGISGVRKMTGACSEIFITESGVMYKGSTTTDAKSYKGQKIGMAVDTAVSADAETIRVISQHAIFHLDADLCSLQCEVAGIEMKIRREHPTLIRTGMNYTLVYPKGQGYHCDPLTQCSLNKPHKFCGSPARFSIKCNGRNFYWNPLLSYVEDQEGCSHPESSENLTVHIGNMHYRLDDKMRISVPKDDNHVYRVKSFLMSHGSIFSIEDLTSVGESWKAFKSSEKKSLILTSGQSVDQKSMGLAGLTKMLSAPFLFIAKLLGHTEILIVSIAIIILTYCMLKYVVSPFILSNYRKKVNPRREVRYIGNINRPDEIGADERMTDVIWT
ncbi:TPA_asm: G [Rubus alphacytorhabdovirus 1]|nr:TPA_asm: G [Rubus alphacytorhabdovirus 1]